MVDVEIDHRHPLQPRRLGRAGRHRHRGIDAETHRLVGLGVMSGRPHCAEGPLEGPRGHALDRLDHRPAGPFGGRQTAGRHGGVGIQPHPALRRRGPPDRRDIGLGMHPQEIGVLDTRRLAQVAVETGVGQGRGHGGQPVRALGMPLARLVGQHVAVGEDRNGHGGNIAIRALW